MNVESLPGLEEVMTGMQPDKYTSDWAEAADTAARVTKMLIFNLAHRVKKKKKKKDSSLVVLVSTDLKLK